MLVDGNNVVCENICELYEFENELPCPFATRCPLTPKPEGYKCSRLHFDGDVEKQEDGSESGYVLVSCGFPRQKSICGRTRDYQSYYVTIKPDPEAKP